MRESPLSPSQGFRPNGTTFSLPVNFDYGNLQPSSEITPSALRDNAARLSEQLALGQLIPPAPVDFTTWSDLQEITKNVSWAWPGWLPNGFVTMIAAESGQGKSLLALCIAGLFTTGKPFPTGDSSVAQEGKVLWIETEHAQAMNLDRLAKFGLDPSCFINPLPDPLATVQLESPSHREEILKRAHLSEVGLIVVDSLSGAHRQKENGTEMIEVMSFLAELATATNKPVIVNHHFNKLLTDGSVPNLSRVRGSSSIVQFCRVVWALDIPNLQEPGLKRLSVIKNNLAEFPQPLGFRITDSGLVFTDAPESGPAQLRIEEAVEWLTDILKDGAIRQKEIEQRAEGDGLKMKAVRRAMALLHIRPFKKNGVHSYWQLPPQQAQQEEPDEQVGQVGNVGTLDFFESGNQGDDGEEKK